MRQQALAAAVCAVAFIAAGPAQAQSQPYPTRAVTIIVPFGPGAGTDAEARLWAKKLSDQVGQSFVTDYKPGAGATVGTNFVAKSKPDGYTVLVITDSFSAAPSIYKDLPYDPVKDLAPVSLMSKRATAIVTNIDRPYSNLKEYVAYAKANPGKINIGTTGLGGSPHLNGEWFHSLTGTKATFVHYKAAATSLTDLMAGRLDVIFTTLISGLPHIKSGKVKVLGLGNAEGSRLLPEALPATEQGVKGYDYFSLFGFGQPTGVELPGEVRGTMRSPDDPAWTVVDLATNAFTPPGCHNPARKRE